MMDNNNNPMMPGGYNADVKGKRNRYRWVLAAVVSLLVAGAVVALLLLKPWEKDESPYCSSHSEATDSYGIIASGTTDEYYHTSGYEPNAYCQWEVMPSDPSAVALRFHLQRLDLGEDDFVIVSDRNGNEIKTFSGTEGDTNWSTSFNVETSSASVVFNASSSNGDDDFYHTGFSMTYSAMTSLDFCCETCSYGGSCTEAGECVCASGQ